MEWVAVAVVGGTIGIIVSTWAMKLANVNRLYIAKPHVTF